MYAYVLLSLILAIVSQELVADQPAPDPVVAIAGAVAVMVGLSLVGLAITAYIVLGRGALDRDEQRFLRRVGVLGKTYRLLVVAAYATVLFEFRWAALAANVGRVEGWTLPALGLALAPLLAMLVVSWVSLYWADRRLRAILFERVGAGSAVQHWTLPRYLEFMARQYLLVVLVPMAVLLSVHDAVALWVGPPEQQPLSLLVFVGAVFGAVMLAGPWLRLCWRTEPLPDGDLRRRLQALADRAGIRIGNILVWRTNLSIANGCMIGIVGPLRYILITDALLLSMTPEEVEAVFAHEVAHVKYHHVVLFMIVAFGGMGAAVLVGDAVAAFAPSYWVMNGVSGAIVLLYWWLGFGFVSRRCELECDLYAVRATTCPAGCSPPDAGRRSLRRAAENAAAPPAESLAAPTALVPAEGPPLLATFVLPPEPPAAPPADGSSLCDHRIQTFVSSLRRIARLNGSAETTRGWRHFSIARRCRFLLDVAGNPERVARAERRFVWVKILALAVSILLGMTAVAYVGYMEASQPDEPEDTTGPDDVEPRVPRWLIRFIQRDEVDGVAVGSPEFHGHADPAADLDDGGAAGFGRGATARDHEVAVADSRGHAVAVDAQGKGPRPERPQAGHVNVLDDSVGRGRG